jgi:geranylgeranyl pyrophosphate synthase
MSVQASVFDVWSNSQIVPEYIDAMRQIILPQSSQNEDTLSTLPALFCEAYCGNKKQVAPIMNAWNLLRYAARLLDDVEDGDRLIDKQNIPKALNISTGLMFTASFFLNELEAVGVTIDVGHNIRRFFYQKLLQTCGGQHTDLTNKTPSLEECWQIIKSKSGVPLGLVCWAGARIATNNKQQLELAWQIGFHLGLLDQIKDDLSDLWDSRESTNDLKSNNSWGLPVAYAISVLPEKQQKKLMTHIKEAPNNIEDEAQARSLIINSGAGIYLTVQSSFYYQKAMDNLRKLNISDSFRDKLANIFGELQMSL